MAKILIADDEPGIRILIEQTLESLEGKGAELLHANNGKHKSINPQVKQYPVPY